MLTAPLLLTLLWPPTAACSHRVAVGTRLMSTATRFVHRGCAVRRRAAARVACQSMPSVRLSLVFHYLERGKRLRRRSAAAREGGGGVITHVSMCTPGEVFAACVGLSLHPRRCGHPTVGIDVRIACLAAGKTSMLEEPSKRFETREAAADQVTAFGVQIDIRRRRCFIAD